MLSEDEREAIERLKAQLNFWKKQNIKNSDCEIILNLITKLQKENEERDKQIDLTAKFIKNNMSENKIINEICVKGKCNNEECHEDDLKECIKQYYERKARDGRN